MYKQSFQIIPLLYLSQRSIVYKVLKISMKQMENEKSESKSANLTNIKNRYSSTKMVRGKKVGVIFLLITV